jgi:hypothetical protein
MAFRCTCTLTDCAYYTSPTGKADECECLHTDKPHYPKNPCPLYRKNWMERDQKAEELKAKLFKRR